MEQDKPDASSPQLLERFSFRLPERGEVELVTLQLADGRVIVREASELEAAPGTPAAARVKP